MLADNGGEILGGLSALTFEHRFSTTDTTSQAFVSYFVAGSTDQFKLVVQNNGDLLATIAGSQIIASNFDFRTLADGQEHAIAFTWDNTTGSWALYVNGSSVEDGTALATGLTIASGGALVVGNDQDSPAVNFDPDVSQQATLHGTRLFNDVRTADEISASYRTDLPYNCLLYTSPSPRDRTRSRMPSSA